MLKGRVCGRQIRVQKLPLYRAEESLSLALLPPLTAESTFQSPGPHAQGAHVSARTDLGSLGNQGGVLFSACGSSQLSQLSQLSQHPSVPMAPPSSLSIPQYLWLLPALPASVNTYGSSQLSQHPSVPMAPPSSPRIPQYLWLLLALLTPSPTLNFSFLGARL